MTMTSFGVPVQVQHKLFDPDQPPLLKNHRISELEDIVDVYGESVMEQGIVQYKLLDRFHSCGGKFISVGDAILPQLDGTAYYGSTSIGDSQAKYRMKSTAYRTDYWTRIERPCTVARDGSDTVTEIYSSSIEELTQVEDTLEASISVTANAQGIVYSGSVTASISATISSLHSSTKISSTEYSTSSTREVRSGNTYLFWVKYRRIDLIVEPVFADGDDAGPFRQDLMEKLLPHTMTCYIRLRDFGDVYETAKIGQG